LASSVNNAGDVGHAPRAGGRRSNRLGNHKERRFRRNKRLTAQTQANAKKRRWQPGWQFRACVPDDRPQYGAHPPRTGNVHPARPTGKFPRLQKVRPREQQSTPFTNRSDFYRYKGRTEAQIWQVDNLEEAKQLLSVMRSISEKRPARSELQSTYESNGGSRMLGSPGRSSGISCAQSGQRMIVKARHHVTATRTRSAGTGGFVFVQRLMQ